MKKYSFKYDFAEGCHPAILEELVKTNYSQQAGYGNDEFSSEAKALIGKIIKKPEAAIYFVSGGTQANLIVISALLRPYEAVISAQSGHIANHETGAIEASGHKVEQIPHQFGKIKSADIEKVMYNYMPPHTVKPKMVYITHSTELGTIYSKAELEEIAKTCKKHQLYLFLDGARIGTALTSPLNDVSLADLAQLTDVFYIGGTKNGALLGEAIVIANPALKTDFELNIKQKGGLLAKSRLIGTQFLVLFNSNLFFDLAQHANEMATKIAATFTALGVPLECPAETNQLFPILPNSIIDKLLEHFDFYIWEKKDTETSIIRIVTSWATPEKEVEHFIKTLKSYLL